MNEYWQECILYNSKFMMFGEAVYGLSLVINLKIEKDVNDDPFEFYIAVLLFLFFEQYLDLNSFVTISPKSHPIFLPLS